MIFYLSQAEQNEFQHNYKSKNFVVSLDKGWSQTVDANGNDVWYKGYLDQGDLGSQVLDIVEETTPTHSGNFCIIRVTDNGINLRSDNNRIFPIWVGKDFVSNIILTSEPVWKNDVIDINNDFTVEHHYFTENSDREIDFSLAPGVQGQLFDVWTKEELDNIVNIMRRLPNAKSMGNECKGITESHMLYPWFKRHVFDRVQDLVGKDIKLQYGMFLNELVPWDIHTDTYHVENDKHKKTALSVIIPYSVDDSVDLIDNSYTIVFNEKGTRYDISKIAAGPIVKNNASDIYEQHLTHTNIELVKRITLAGAYKWKLGSAIYWESAMLHTSNDYQKLGFKSKQAIVMHTYRDR